MDENGKFYKRVVIVTGSTRGIGLACVRTFAKEGAAVIMNGRRSKEDCGELLKKFSEQGCSVDYIQGDMTEEVQADYLCRQVYQKWGRIDILVNNVGGTTICPVLKLSGKAIEASFRENTISAFFTIKYVLKVMLMQHYGRIINISSVAGTKGMALQSHYAAAKAAIIGLTKSVAAEVGTKGITCNAVLPGALQGNSLYSVEQENQLLAMSPVKRLGRPEDVAAAVAFLSGEEAEFITGAELKVDGGMWM